MTVENLGIPNLHDVPEKKKVPVDFEGDEHSDLQDYQKAYKAIYGHEIELGVLVKALALKSLKNDRQFKKWLKTSGESTNQEEAASAA